MRLIDADKLIKEDWILERHGISNKNLSSMSIADVPVVDAEPVRHGHWIVPSNSSTIACICSNCDWESHYYEDDVNGMQYCPNCGAKMR